MLDTSWLWGKRENDGGGDRFDGSFPEREWPVSFGRQKWKDLFPAATATPASVGLTHDLNFQYVPINFFS